MPRCNTSWSIGGTDTFRNRSRKLLDRWGTNQQNISSNISRIYIPDENKIFVSADCAGAEALIVAYLCPEGKFRSLFTVGIKPHVFVALHLFAKHWSTTFGDTIASMLNLSPIALSNHPNWKEVSKAIKNHETYYFIGKKSCHSFNYRKQAGGFIFDVLKESEGRVVLSKKEGERIRDMYVSVLFPEIEQVWHKEQDDILRRTRTLRNLFGYPRTFYGTFTDSFFREATAFIPQSTVGCITNIAFARLQCKIEAEGLPWDLLNNKHDSVLVQCPIEDKDLATIALRESLEQELISPRGEHFKMKSEVSVGLNWGKYNVTDNPEGMREI